MGVGEASRQHLCWSIYWSTGMGLSWGQVPDSWWLKVKMLWRAHLHCLTHWSGACLLAQLLSPVRLQRRGL